MARIQERVFALLRNVFDEGRVRPAEDNVTSGATMRREYHRCALEGLRLIKEAALPGEDHELVARKASSDLCLDFGLPAHSAARVAPLTLIPVDQHDCVLGWVRRWQSLVEQRLELEGMPELPIHGGFYRLA